jgi:hypothetical protein
MKYTTFKITISTGTDLKFFEVAAVSVESAIADVQEIYSGTAPVVSVGIL